MATIAELEAQRLQAQAFLDAQKDADERNRTGQFATPPRLAVDIATYAWEHWKHRADTVRFLDPALGTGSFYSALRQVFPADLIQAAAGIELDPLLADAAASLWGPSGFEVVRGDFTKSKAPLPDQRFNLILTNPPYVRHHHLSREEKQRLQSVVARDLGIKLSGLAGLYCYFLLLGDKWLADGGLAVWLIPSEFMDVNYGQAVKRYLTHQVKLLHIHRFSPSEVQFSDALVSSAVVVFEKSPPSPGQTVLFTLGGTLLEPQASQRLPLSLLRKTRKWTSYPEASQQPGVPASVPGITLGDLFTIKRGLATGANDFFIIPKEQADRWVIPATITKPILPSPRHLPLQVIESDADGYPRVSPVLCLIDCDCPEEELREKFPTFWEYLQTGKQRHIHEGYLASRRSPWYSQEKREPAPFLCTYMGRTSNGRKPFRFIWNQSAALASNLYLLLYPKGPLRAALAADPQRYAAVFAALHEIDRDMFLREGRVYGGGLYKMEPKELGRLPAELLLYALEGVEISRQGQLFS
jgi:hypothetical protein